MLQEILLNRYENLMYIYTGILYTYSMYTVVMIYCIISIVEVERCLG